MMMDPSGMVPKRKPSLVRRILRRVLLGLLLLLAGTIAYGMLRAEYLTVYQGYQTSKGDLSSSVEFNSTVRLVDSKAYTAEYAGKVRKIPVKAGDDVKKNDVLMILGNGSRIRADFDGTVNTVSVKEGDSFVAGDQFIEVADFHHLKVTFNVDEYAIGKLKRNDYVQVSISSINQKYKAKVASIDYQPTSRRNMSYYAVTAYLDAKEGLHPGMRAKVTVTQKLAENATIVSRKALGFSNGNEAYVYLKDEGGKMYQQPVHLGAHNDDTAEIVDGVEAGTVVYAKVESEDGASGIFGMMQQRMQNRMQQQNNTNNNRYGNFNNNRNGYNNWNGGWNNRN